MSGTVGDDDGGGMGADVASQAFDFAGQVEQFVDFVVGLVGLLQIGAFFQCFVQGDIERGGDHGDDGVDAGNGDA